LKWLGPVLAKAAEGRQKAIAAEAFPSMSLDAAQAELSKYLASARGDSAFRVVEAVCKLGHRDILRLELEERLREVSAGQLVDAVHEIQAQLELFGARVRVLGERMEEVGQVLPLRRKPGG